MVRDHYRTKEYFDQYILEETESVKKDRGWLYNFLLYNKGQDAEKIEGNLLFSKRYSFLQRTILERNSKLMKEYLDKKWYSKFKDCGWYDSHMNNKRLYFGYWCFESAAIVKLLDLDDSSLEGQIFYPYDLVHEVK